MGTYTTNTGKSGAFDNTLVNNDGTRTKTEALTGANGKSVERVVETTRDGYTIVRTVASVQSN